MNFKQIHTIANVAGSVYRIAYTSMLLYYLFNRKRHEPLPPSPDMHRK